jgi:hypothetical protein
LYIPFAGPIDQQNVRMNFFGPLCLDDGHVSRVQKFDLSRAFSPEGA